MIKKFFSRGYIFLILAFIYIPIFILILYSFNHSKNFTGFSNYVFSFRWYSELARIKDVVFNTVMLAVVSSLIANVHATLIL